MNEIKLVIFDMSGTTVRDKGQVVNAFASALAQHDIDVTHDQLNRVRGSSKQEAVLSFIPECPNRIHRAEMIYASFRKNLVEQYNRTGIEPIAGAEEIFGWLRERGIFVALNTGFDTEITQSLLISLKWNQGVVDAVVCGDQVTRGRPAADLIFRTMKETGITSVKHVATVGDTVLDLEAGQNAGVRWNIGVLSGAHSRELLERAPCTHILHSVRDLPDLWRI